MSDTSWLEWPFFDDRHREFAQDLQAWCERALANVDHSDTDAACRHPVHELGEAGWLRYVVPEGPEGTWGGRWPAIDSRAECGRAGQGWSRARGAGQGVVSDGG